jgi:hypothetical protein
MPQNKINMTSSVLIKRLIILLFLFSLFGCEKIANETDPSKIILGKWRLIEMGNWPNMDSYQDDGYIKFLPDSVKIEYAPDLNEYTHKKYWIDSLLNECIFSQAENCLVLK